MRLLSARLSSKRRSRYAGVVVMLLGLLVTGGAYAVLSPAQADEEDYFVDNYQYNRHQLDKHPGSVLQLDAAQ